MLGLRLQPTDRYHPRPRLLERLPDTPGFVVALEAPYGYGKSVLAMQWGERLATDGWRLAWVALAGQDPRAALARELGQPPQAPWGVVLDELWSRPTLVVLEDLEGNEPLEPLLKRVEGLLALASRGPLPFPALLPWMTSGRLLRITADDLRFTANEVVPLFRDERRALDAWQQTGGWPLPLHFAALTGRTPDRTVLGEGVRASVEEAAWHEALLIASLDLLPHAHANDATRALADGGFVQAVEAGFRLHPLVAESVLERHAQEVRAAVAQLAGRLPSALRGEAFERVGHVDGLRAILDDPVDETYRTHPADYLRWHALVADPPSAVRRSQAAIARMLTGDLDGGLADAARLRDDANADAIWRVRVAAAAIHHLGEHGRVAEAQPYLDVLDAHALGLPAFDAARVAQTRMLVAFRGGDVEAVETHLATARAALAQASHDPRHAEATLILTGTVAQMRWLTRGEVGPQRQALAAALDGVRSVQGDDASSTQGVPTSLTVTRLAAQLASLHALAGDDTAARAVAARWLGRYRGPEAWALEAVAAELDGDLAALDRLLDEVRRWERGEYADLMGAVLLRSLRRTGDAAGADQRRARLTFGPSTRLAWAVHEAEHAPAAAEATLAELEHLTDRSLRLAWHAAAYQIRRDTGHLDAIRSLTDAGDAALRWLGVRLQDLPRDRPDLARAYPLTEVVDSGWSEAIRLREAELPPLELQLLGRVQVRSVLGALDVSERQRQLLVLIALGHTREAIGAALWPEADAAKVRNNLNVQLSGLRRALQPWGSTTYLEDVRLTRCETDLAALEAALEAGDWPGVAERYRGRLAGEVDLPLVTEAADALERRVLEGLRDAARAAHVAAAVPLLDKLVAIDPFHEEAFVELLSALLQLGRRREAERRHAAWAQRWRDELGFEPPPIPEPPTA